MKNSFRKNKVSRAITGTFAVASLSLLSISPSYAAEEDESSDEPEKIVVTGSRIQRSSAQMTTPTTVISAETIEATGLKNVGDILNQYPALLDGLGGTGNNDSGNGGPYQAGLELANLRGLGTERTLVLVNGKRHVPGTAGTSSVDLSMIPSELIERIELITGGASAVYGSDAVTGVVNIILKENFEGTIIKASHGTTAESDGDSNDVAFTWGTNFADGKANITAHLSYSEEQEIPMTARSYSLLRPSFRSNPANTGPNDGISDTLYFRDVRFQALSAEGLFYVPNANYLFGDTPITDLPFPTFADDPIEFGFGYVGYDTYTIDRDTGEFRDFVGGTNCQVVPCDGGDGFRTAETNTLNSPSDRILFNLFSRYEIDEDFSIFGEFKYGKVESAASGQASVFHDDNFGPLIRINDDNPFRPQALTTLMADRGLSSVALAVVGLQARSSNTRETMQFAFGGEGVMGEYNYDFYVQHGRVESDIRQRDVLIDRYYEALDAVDDGNGNAICRSGNASCVAYNPINFGASTEARNYVGVWTNAQEKNTLSVANFSFNGELFEAPAGTVDFASGVEYRRETSDSIPDILTRSVDADGLPLPLLGSTTGASAEENSALSIVSGSYNVAEIYGEAIIPLLFDVTAVDFLELELAARYSKHSVTGGDTTFKASLNWGITEQFRTRYTISRAVRAPNIGELFAPEQSSSAFMTDPCHVDNLPLATQGSGRLANCAALGLAPDFISQASFGSRNTTTVGNDELTPEVADSYSVGLVFTPMDNLNITVDYWDIEITDAITLFDSTDVLNNCVDGAALNAEFCALISRDSGGQITNVNLQSINAAAFTANGVDLDVNYMMDLGDSSLSFSFKGTYLDERNFQQNANDATDIDKQAGELGTPHFRALIGTVFSMEDFTASWNINYIAESTLDKNVDSAEYYPAGYNGKAKAVVYHNLNLNYVYNETYQVSFGVNNLTNETPEILPGLTSGGLLYDAIGRRYYLSVKASF